MNYNKLDTFLTPSNITSVSIIVEDVLSYCPIDKMLNSFRIEVLYIPNKFCITTKSLELYLLTFKTKEILSENLVSEIIDIINININAKYIKVISSLNIKNKFNTKLLSTAEINNYE